MIQRLTPKLFPDPKRVLLQFFELNPARTKKVIQRVSSLDEKEVINILNKVFNDFSKRHKNFEEIVLSNFKKVEKYIQSPDQMSSDRKLLIGSYFSKEYSISAAALFNPSMVPHPDQSKIEKDSLRFVMSLRATGEGHISSIEFREGIIDKNSEVHLQKKSRYITQPKIIKLKQDEILIEKLKYTANSKSEIKDLLDSNYICNFSDDVQLSERVLFPYSKSESVGMEDARFVRFNDKNDFTYFGTYTAYNGRKFRTQIIETKDFRNFKIGTLHGNAISDKGMALFPRKINNKYVITSRQDSENIFIMLSDNIYYWNDAKIIKSLDQPWEYIQVGNCGSPIETNKGWILITHAVGPMRKYVISAVLLDLENPSKVIGSLTDPLIEPNEEEREGYTPNVVYSCGSLVHRNNLIIPYAFSDSACGFASIKIPELLKKFK
ncbi:MAG TPA: glycoside hydrolase family 130 protein [Ignavibacteriaceae bacterium]|nr:glycoside hydrolase family 130 protein [Ignavibacteriaceae bacterium]